MNYGSVCSGIEAASLAWRGLGWKPLFVSEVEPFPAAVLCERLNATRPLRPLDPAAAPTPKDRKLRESWAKAVKTLPETGTLPNLGDFTHIKETDYDGNLDLLVGGTPCQSFSLAGLRRGLADPRGNLCLEFAKLAYRTHTRLVVWENVPGVLSSGKGCDFAGFLSLLCGWEVPVPDGGWRKCGVVTHAPGCFGVAWRVLDAQYTRVPEFPGAVPQRRRRVILVGHLDSWEYPAEVLFDGEMCGGDTPPRRETRQGSATDSEGRAPAAHTIRMRAGKPGGGKGALVSDELSLTLATGNDQTLVQFDGAEEPCWWDGGQKADTLTTTSDRQLMPDKKKLQCVLDMRQIEACAEDVAPTLISTDYKGGKTVCETVCPTLDASYPGKMNNQDTGKLVCYENHPNDSRVTESGDCAPTLSGRAGTGGGNLPLVQEIETLGFIKNDAGGTNTAGRNVFPTIRTDVMPAVAFNVTFCDANGRRKDRPDGGLYVTPADAGKALTAGGGKAETVVIALDGDKMAKAERKGGSGLGVSDAGAMYTETAKDVHGVCYPIDTMNCAGRDGNDSNGFGVGGDGDPSPTLSKAHHHAVCHQPLKDCADTLTATYANHYNGNAPAYNGSLFAKSRGVVRRLLPVECERLMGMPDGYTLIPWRGKPASDCPDAPRYKALGNSMCVNVMMWVGQRIQRQEEKTRHGNG